MKRFWTAGLMLSLGGLLPGARANDVVASADRAPVASTPAASLGRPAVVSRYRAASAIETASYDEWPAPAARRNVAAVGARSRPPAPVATARTPQPTITAVIPVAEQGSPGSTRPGPSRCRRPTARPPRPSPRPSPPPPPPTAPAWTGWAITTRPTR
jgi:hypothetical protein